MNTVSRLAAAALAAVLLVAAAARGADDPPAAATPAAPTAEAAPAPPVPEPAAGVPPAAPAPLAATPEQLQTELAALRNDMRMLQSTLDLMVNKIMADLREENEQLREEIRRLNALRGMPGMADVNAVPRPAGGVVDQVLSEPAPVPELPPPPPFKFTVVREWGRTAEEAMRLGGEAQSLKGVIGYVPAGSLREDVEKLARDLRTRYDTFDNINIEVFDDPLVAKAFAANQTADSQRRVLSVSRHKASGRDAIVLLVNGKGEMISLDPNEPPPPPQPDDMPTLTGTRPAEPEQQKPSQAVYDGTAEDGTEAAPSDRTVETPDETASTPGGWQKMGKKKAEKGSSKKKKGQPEEEPEIPAGQRPIPEGPFPLVPHEPAPNEPQVLVAPPGEPVNMAPAPSETGSAPSAEAGEAKGDEAKNGEAKPADEPKPNPKAKYGPKGKKSRK